MIKRAGDRSFSAQYDYKLFPFKWCELHLGVFLKSRYAYLTFPNMGLD